MAHHRRWSLRKLRRVRTSVPKRSILMLLLCQTQSSPQSFLLRLYLEHVTQALGELLDQLPSGANLSRFYGVVSLQRELADMPAIKRGS